MPYALRACATCGTEFRPSSGHLTCPPCRHAAQKKPCPRCGKVLVGRKSASCRGCVVHVGEMNPNWKGGETRHKRGYVLHWADGHPAAVNGYVFEHRLVMEHQLGRYLEPNENVHHKNGNKADNRIENLELWVVSQPSGQRVEDLVAWAREILEKYGD